MVLPRIALASGFAAATGAALLIAGRVDGSVPLLLALTVAARAAAPAASAGPGGPHALARHVAMLPAWVAVAFVGAVRAGSADLAAVRGANAVAGLALVRGDVLVVSACWVAALAGVLAMLGPRGRLVRGFEELDAAALVVQAGMLVTLFAGPQVRDASDVTAWLGAATAIGAAWFVAHRVARWEWLPKVAIALGALAVGLSLAGERL